MEGDFSHKIASSLMLEHDPFSKWLGISIIEISPGYCKLRCHVKKDMLNGFNILHGGVSYSIADSALAFASNAHNKKSYSIETSISHIKKVMEGDTLIAECRELSLSSRFGIYEVIISNQYHEKIALFKGTVYRTTEKWIEPGISEI